MRTRLALVLVLTLATLALTSGGSRAGVEDNVWVSLDTLGNQFAAASGSYNYPAAMSADGRYVAFQTLSTLTREGDSNNAEDVFFRDTGRASSGDDDPGEPASTTLVSISTDGVHGDNRSYGPDMTADASLLVFESQATNLVEGDANNASDIFLRDFGAGTTTRISATPNGGDASGASYRAAISADGAFVAFCSRATNLAPDDGNIAADAFLVERATGAVTRIAIEGTTGGASEGCLSVDVNDDGSKVAYAAVAGTRSDVFLYDRASGGSSNITGGSDGSSGLSRVAISGDGNIVAFDSLATDLAGGDSNRSRDVFVRDVQAATTTRVSVRSDGSQLPGDSGTSGLAVSRDGRFVVFDSAARGVIPGDSNGHQDVYRHDLTTGETTLGSVNVFDQVPNDSSYSPSINQDGSIVAYTSMGGNIRYGDNNQQPDVFLRKGNFPATSGDGGGPMETGAPEEGDPLAPVFTSDDDGIPTLAIFGAIAGGLVVALILLSLFLGRRGKA